ncbi:MAG: hypothetical protein KDA68_14560 [Planctomycetaceae bacterium]|nr:hypothetical protein [Planctomycetaceae bacterium]
MRAKSSIGLRARTGLVLICLGICAACVLKTRTDKSFESLGKTIPTGKALDLAILGEGYFQIAHEGTTYYTRHGKFRLNADRVISFGAPESGFALSPIVNIPTQTTRIEIMRDGTIGVDRMYEQQRTFVGCLQLATFSSADDLEPVGNGLFRLKENARSSPFVGNPGFHAAGIVQQGLIERGSDHSESNSLSLKTAPLGHPDAIVLE